MWKLFCLNISITPFSLNTRVDDPGAGVPYAQDPVGSNWSKWLKAGTGALKPVGQSHLTFCFIFFGQLHSKQSGGASPALCKSRIPVARESVLCLHGPRSVQLGPRVPGRPWGSPGKGTNSSGKKGINGSLAFVSLLQVPTDSWAKGGVSHVRSGSTPRARP